MPDNTPTDTPPRTTFADKKEADVQKHRSIYLAKIIWDNWKDVLWCNGSFWMWGGQVYKKIDDIDWAILTAERFPAFDESAPSRQKEIMEVYKRFSKIDSKKFNSEDGLCLENAYIDLEDCSIHKHDKKRINTILIPYHYDKKATCPLFLKSVGEILINDFNKIKCLQEFFGYALTRSTKYAKALFLIGDGNTGKSTILNIIELLVGSENVSHLSPRYLKDNMQLSEIENKLVLICHEVPKRLEDYEAEFRKIVSGQKFNVHAKWVKPYDIKPFCKIIWAMNDLPRIDDHTSAFFNRMLPMEFERTFIEEEQDKDLVNKLIPELPGILNWTLEGLTRLRERGSFFRDAYMRENIEEMRMANNPVAIWAKENIAVVKGSEIIKSEVYEKYDVWCKHNGHRPTSSSKFSTEFFRLYKNVTNKNSRQSYGDERRYVWPNLAWATGLEKEAQATWAE